MTVEVYAGDCRQVLRLLAEVGLEVDSVVTDPPYHLESVVKRFGKDGSAPARFGSDGAFARQSANFVGKRWDGSDENGTRIAQDPEFWRLVYDLMKPGAFCIAFSGARTGHWQAVAMEQAGFIMHPMIGWAYGCLDDRTECLTKRGWTHYGDLKVTDEVLQWDSETTELSWTCPQKIHRYPFDGDLVTIENRHTRQALTPNHRVYAKIRRHSRHARPTKFEVLPAQAVHARPGNWNIDLPLAGILRGGENIDPDYAYLVGWWLTDAWAHADGKACMFSQSKPNTLSRLRAALRKYSPSEYVKRASKENHNDEYTFYLTGSIADQLLLEFPERKLPWFVLEWSLEARQRLYDGLMDGDGTRRSDERVETFWSQDATRRDVFVALALSIGRRAYGDAKKGAVYTNSKMSTQIQGRHRPEKLRYKGEVWCLSVPTGAFVVRRDDRPFITGNSGFPKPHNASKAIDREVGVEGSFEAYQWDGWAYGAQSLKPALEPIYVGQKPFSEKNGALNLLRHGVGAMNIDGCRVPTTDSLDRHPANLVHDGSEEVAALFPDDSARFFNSFPPLIYHAKANKQDREGSNHPTVKPIGLMRHLVRLVTPPGGLVLDPFAGSGSTAKAAVDENCRSILIEREVEYLEFLGRRFGTDRASTDFQVAE